MGLVKYILFIIGSSIENFAVFVLMFTLFRFQITERLRATLFVAFIMSQVSYFTRLVPEIGSLSSFIQLALLVIVLWILFRVPLYYSAVMNAASFIVGFAVQGIITLAVTLSGVPFSKISGDDPLISTAVQLMSALIYIAISWFIHTRNIGFDYVPADQRSYVRMRGTNAALLAVILSSIFVAIIASRILLGEYEDYVIVASVTFIITIPLFLYYSRRKDKEDAA